MSLKEFLQNDIFRNTLVATPRFEFRIYNGKVVNINQSAVSAIGDSLNISDLPVAQFGVFDFSFEQYSFMITIL